MYISSLVLENFRSYPNTTFQFCPETNLIIGPNGSGKTNVLEAIYFLSSGKSFRSSSLSQLIHWDSPFSTVSGRVTNDDQTHHLEIQLIHNQNGGSHTLRKFLVEKITKTRGKYLNIFPVVAFHPEDIRLVTSSPTRRRDFLDAIFTSIEWRYASALTTYNKALKHRNKLLDLIKVNQAQKSELFYWDQSLIKNDEIIHHYRQAFITHANLFFKQHVHPEINTLALQYLPSVVSLEKLEHGYFIDLERGFTQSGLHRDDFVFNNSIFPSSDQDLAHWGSRGQQRLAVLAIRLAQIDFFERTYHQHPVLLLDDIFSELDPSHQQLVVKICDRYQTLFTSSDEESATILPTAQIQKL